MLNEFFAEGIKISEYQNNVFSSTEQNLNNWTKNGNAVITFVNNENIVNFTNTGNDTLLNVYKTHFQAVYGVTLTDAQANIILTAWQNNPNLSLYMYFYGSDLYYWDLTSNMDYNTFSNNNSVYYTNGYHAYLNYTRQNDISFDYKQNFSIDNIKKQVVLGKFSSYNENILKVGQLIKTLFYNKYNVTLTDGACYSTAAMLSQNRDNKLYSYYNTYNKFTYLFSTSSMDETKFMNCEPNYNMPNVYYGAIKENFTNTYQPFVYYSTLSLANYISQPYIFDTYANLELLVSCGNIQINKTVEDEALYVAKLKFYTSSGFTTGTNTLVITSGNNITNINLDNTVANNYESYSTLITADGTDLNFKIDLEKMIGSNITLNIKDIGLYKID